MTEVARHVYQSSGGGKTYVPMEVGARVLAGATTPQLAKMLSWKYTKMAAADVAEDFCLNHHRSISRSFVQDVCHTVAEIAVENENDWSYALPTMPQVVSHIAIGRDGAMMPIRGEGYREAMNGTIALYNPATERMHTIYVSCAPQHGRQSFGEVLEREIGEIMGIYPALPRIGLGDGARENWTYLGSRTDVEILDFYHVTEYLAAVSAPMAAAGESPQDWLSDACHRLKHDPTGAADILNEMQQKSAAIRSKQKKILLGTTITYFTNNSSRMKYPEYVAKNYPIGSGVTEAACKVMVKQRLCASGMRWTTTRTDDMLLLKGLTQTPGRWDQFWKHIDNHGVAAGQ